jgi:hypothetical protein
MRRLLLLVSASVLFVGCDKLRKKHEPDPEPAGSGSAAPSTGHSVTHLKEDGDTGSGAGSAHASASGAGSGSGSGSGHAAHLMGGDGSPSMRADDGRVHGPGGPVFMGRGVDCDAPHDHCLRDGVWFSVGNIQPGKLYRALPVFEFEKKWWTWRGEPADTPVKLYKTQIAGNATLSPGTAVIWFSSETSDKKWADSEYEAMTSSRWEAGVVESQQSPTVVMIKGWGAASLDTIRLITETRDP